MCFFNVSYKYAVETKTQYIATSWLISAESNLQNCTEKASTN